MHIGKRPFSSKTGPKSITVDLRKLIVPSVLLLGLAFYSWYRLGADPQEQMPADRGANFRLSEGTQVPRLVPDSELPPHQRALKPRTPSRLIIEDLPPLPTVETPLEYKPDSGELAAIMDTVVDGDAELDVDGRLQIIGEGLLPERIAVIELFHRVRAGASVPIQPSIPVFPHEDYEQVRQVSLENRGKRYSFPAEVVGDPYPEELGPNKSGVLTFWNLFAQDRITGRLHRVLFFTEETTSPIRNGDSVTITADYLRLYAYLTTAGRPARVPHWVAADVVLDAPPTVTAWTPVFWVSAIALGGLAILALSMVAQNLGSGSHDQRRRRAREAGLSQS